MDVYEVRQKAQYHNIRDMNLRVVYYARVSTEKEEQLNALDNQFKYYEDYISSCPNWEFIRGYVDEGISGVTTNKRDSFADMIYDAENGEFDIIITKEVSRFARNTLDSIQYTRELLKKGVAVYFKEDNINTLDPDGELRLTIMASLAQDESRRISNRIKIGHSMAIKKGRVLGNSRIYGYNLKNAKLEIVEDEAEMVRKIFGLYATGDYSTNRIENILYQDGYRSRAGKKIDRRVIGNIIKNPKYKGYYCGNKVKIVDMFTKAQKFLPEEEWVMWKDETGKTIPAIVDEELWERANEVFRARSKEVKLRSGKQNHNNLFTSKIMCGNDGSNYRLKYRRLRGEKVSPRWACTHKLKDGTDKCSSFAIKEDILIDIVKDVINILCKDNKKITDNYIELYKKELQNNNTEQKLVDLKNKVQKLTSKQDKLVDLVMEDLISKDSFKERNQVLEDDIKKYKDEIKTIENSESSLESNLQRINNMQKYLEEIIKEPNDGELTQGIIDTLIEKIIITPIKNDKKGAEAVVDVILRSDKKIVYKINKNNNDFVFRLENICKKMMSKRNTYSTPNRNYLEHTMNVDIILNIWM